MKVSRDPRQQRIEPPPPGLEDEFSTASVPVAGDFSAVGVNVSQAGFMVPAPYPQAMMMAVPPGFVPMLPPAPPVYPMPLPPLPPPPLPPSASSLLIPPAPEPPVINRDQGRDSNTGGKWNKKNKKSKSNEGRYNSGNSRGGYWKSGGRGQEKASSSEWDKDIKNYELQEREHKAKLRKLERRHR